MFNYGGKTPKRHYALSNSEGVGKLYNGKLSRWDKSKNKHSQTTRYYTDSNGKKRFTGTKNLKKTEHTA